MDQKNNETENGYVEIAEKKKEVKKMKFSEPEWVEEANRKLFGAGEAEEDDE